MDDKIIPFGQYKGKPVEVLATDKNYTEWLLAQSWFKEKYLTIYNVVINNFREPADTPEHNKLQIKFLKAEHRLKLAFLVNPRLFQNDSEFLNAEMKKIIKLKELNQGKLFLQSIRSPNPKEEFGLYSKDLLRMSKPVFEHVDVCYSLSYGLSFHYENGHYQSGYREFAHRRLSTYWIELKPTVSDDFPQVLRQMKASMPVEQSDWQRDRFYLLVVGAYTGTSATQEEFVAYFETQGYKVVFENEIERVVLPSFEREFVLSDEIQQQLLTLAK
ncbi:MAG: hypothetical protein QY325_00985 [Flavobacteriales bacterium]|nr:MAG: hypothetical protein QY325_00985 [Flavobacteriales bacterium]